MSTPLPCTDFLESLVVLNTEMLIRLRAVDKDRFTGSIYPPSPATRAKTPVIRSVSELIKSEHVRLRRILREMKQTLAMIRGPDNDSSCKQSTKGIKYQRLY